MREKTHCFIVGIFDENGQPVIALGRSFTATHKQAEAVVRLLEPALQDALKPGHYLAYDYRFEP